jgi:hypothetical protein
MSPTIGFAFMNYGASGFGTATTITVSLRGPWNDSPGTDASELRGLKWLGALCDRRPDGKECKRALNRTLWPITDPASPSTTIRVRVCSGGNGGTTCAPASTSVKPFVLKGY